ncbi:RNA polymerase subunit sigma-70 [Microlunatus parietis]|uniref:RNA polymerase sigma-70 factor (ECF subfamily) n=1 Tax=Microlunatus parietis TaxID=682979 RepID=A0A7Y9ICH4_9ACTN|nr:RNA polymerase subunit sigma-70 [Microlunatus parietis]NYE74322.1 RNA polymerase sigma-70 factor (ECF subfamily) [Microlunatus parietis]
MTGFEDAAAPLRREVLVHCYRMLGSWDEAEDAVQETFLRGWRAWATFEERASVRTWLHRIATNVCLNSVRDRGRRALPAGIGAPADRVDEPGPVLPPETWIQPIADDRQDLRLAVIAGLQTLPPTQRAVLLLRDVLAFSAAEVARMLDLSTAAVKSSLQRARARLAAVAPEPEDVLEPSRPEARRLVDAYVGAFENADVQRLITVLRTDATLQLPPGRDWFAGKASCSQVFAAAVGNPGEWKMRPIVANGQPAVIAAYRGQPFGIAVLDVRTDGIAGVTAFGLPDLVPRFEAARPS